jgi:hypothetical protein
LDLIDISESSKCLAATRLQVKALSRFHDDICVVDYQGSLLPLVAAKKAGILS